LNVLVVLPAHNEALTVGDTIRRIRLEIPDATFWVVDNSSSDATRMVALENGARVLFEPKVGKGFAVQQAFMRVKRDFDLVFMVDADDTYMFDQLKMAANLVFDKKFDMVVGNRVTSSDLHVQRTHAFRKGHAHGNFLLSKLFWFLFGIRIKDTLSGWRVMSPGFVGSFSGGVGGFEIETELNAHAFLTSAAVTNVDVKYVGRTVGSHSKLRTYSDGWRILRRQFSLFFLERPRIAYGVVSLPWIIASIFLIRNVLISYFQLGLIPNFPSLIAGVGCFISGILLLIAGVILENTRAIRVQAAKYKFFEYCE
jgi:glycosyltransferase involved in cell wall biosynthesis